MRDYSLVHVDISDAGTYNKPIGYPSKISLLNRPLRIDIEVSQAQIDCGGIFWGLLYMVFNVKKFHLEASAKRAVAVTDLLAHFATQQASSHNFQNSEAQLLSLLTLSNGEKRDAKQNNPDYIESGIKKMFSLLSQNTIITAVPIDEPLRSSFYQKLFAGFQFLGERIDEDLNKGKIDLAPVYDSMELIVDGGHDCASRWREVLEVLVEKFPPRLLGEELAPDESVDNLKEQLLSLFYEARVIEGNKAAEDFSDHYISDQYTGNRVHYSSFFKRTLRPWEDYPLPTTQEENSFISSIEGDLTKQMKKYLKENALDVKDLQKVLSMDISYALNALKSKNIPSRKIGRLLENSHEDSTVYDPWVTTFVPWSKMICKFLCYEEGDSSIFGGA